MVVKSAGQSMEKSTKMSYPYAKLFIVERINK